MAKPKGSRRGGSKPEDKPKEAAVDTEVTPSAKPETREPIIPPAPETAAVVPQRRNRKPQPQDIKLTARQYVRVRKERWERCAGFLHDMKKKHGSQAMKTRPDWVVEWDAFWTRPVRR